MSAQGQAAGADAELILLVDDAEATRYALTRVLSHAGYRVREAATGSEALELAGELPDLVLLDVDLPDISGYEVCSRLKADPLTRGIPVIQTSAAFTRGEDLLRGVEGGADAYLIAPVDRHVLIGTVKAWLRVRKAERRNQSLLAEVRKVSDDLRQISDSVPIHLIRLDREERFLFANSAAGEMWHRTPAELVGRTILEIAGAETQKALAPYTEKVLRGETVAYESPFRRPDGRMRIFLNTYSPDRDRDGTIQGFIATGTDITERKETEIAMGRLQRHLRLALESARFGTWNIDLRTGRSTLSPAAASIYGLSENAGAEDDLEGAVLRIIHPEDREEVERRWRDSVARREPFSHEYRIVRPDGAVRWVFSRGVTTLGDDGEPAFFFGVVGDITVRKESENQLNFERHKLEVLFRESPAAMALWRGRDLVFEMVNPRYQEVFKGRELIGRPMLEALPEFRDQGFDRHLRQVLESGQAYSGHEVLTRVRKPGMETLEDRYYDYTYVRVSDAKGNPYGVYVHSVDVTDRVLARRDLEESKIHLEEALQDMVRERDLRERFVATLSHDLRTPLTAAKMSAQLLMRRPDETEAVQKVSARIADNMDRADRMIRDLLDANRIKAGQRLPIEIEDCDLNQLASDTLAELGTVHGDRFILRSDSRIQGHWSCGGVRRILENLCNNAIKYGAAGSPVTVSIAREGEEVRFAVHNEGAPIPPEDQAKLFEPFSRTDSAVSGGQKGWGLGLTLVKGIAEAHGGSVRVESAPGQGTTFEVRLPQDARKHRAT